MLHNESIQRAALPRAQREKRSAGLLCSCGMGNGVGGSV